MGLTKDQWYSKLRALLPQWYWEQTGHQVAHAKGLAKILSQTQSDADDHLDETFISTASGEFLDLHGEERGIERLSGESDDTYRERIRNISNRGNVVAIRALVDAIVTDGSGLVHEHWKDFPAFNCSSFFNRRETYMKVIRNFFSVVLDPQDQGIYDALVAALDDARVLGVLYQVIVDNS